MQGREAKDWDDFFGNEGAGGEAGLWLKLPEHESDGFRENDYMVRPPCGHHFLLANKPESHHFVEEHHDGAITVRPNPPGEPNNSNSILCHCGWHGYVDHGRWYSI